MRLARKFVSFCNGYARASNNGARRPLVGARLCFEFALGNRTGQAVHDLGCGRSNVYRVGSWGYTASMPMIFGIGLAPLLQWLILPPVMVSAYRRLGSALFSAKAESEHD
jgi:hypothetical protein